jgi:non-ribosomal peptide synthetase component E (peptide arylation enzyme)
MVNLKETGNNNYQNDITSLQINNTITNNPQEIPNTFNDYYFTVAHTVIGNIKKITVILEIT